MAPETPNPLPAERCVVFTIVSRNYLHFALNLMDSVAAHLPGTRRVIVVCDATDGLPAPEGIELLGIRELPIPHLDRVVLQYTILELNTAIKPYAFQQLFASGADAVVYFDPDIQLYADGTPLRRRLAEADVVLTPHLTAPLDDDRHPSDLSIVQSGTYNLGFLALRRGEAATRLLAWWSAKLLRDCVVDIPRGLFTDQKWMDLVPGLFERVAIERDPGWNVAYWNLAHRRVTRGESGFDVDGRPLFFFHFSGRDPSSDSISKHQDRFTLPQCAPAVRELFAGYEAALRRHGRERHAAMPYAFATLADGTPLPDVARRVLRTELDWTRPMPDLSSPEGVRFVRAFLTGPVDALQPPVPRVAWQLYRLREDLQAAFPDALGVHRHAFLGWFAERAGPEAGVPAALRSASEATAVLPPAAPTAAAAPATAPSSTAAATESAPDAAPAEAVVPIAPVTPAPATSDAPSPRVPLPRRLYRHVYRLAWDARRFARPLVPLALRQRVHAALMRRAFPPVPALPWPAAAPPAAPESTPRPAEALPAGITVVGYVKAESGVGESARATLRALAAAGVPHAFVDFRVGNVSRMQAELADGVPEDRRHAVTLFHVNADQMPVARAHLAEAWFAVPCRIGFWAWELEQFPAVWHEAFELVDEVWVPSSFCQAAVAADSPVPVLCMPHSIEVPEVIQPDRARFGLRQDSIVFLAMADMMSLAERKNPLGAVQAFVAAFEPTDRRAELVVKVSNAERDPAGFERLREAAAAHPGVQLRAEYLDRGDLDTLLDSVDAFVSLHRSEGFGLGIAEAMARGKVAIATGWSGNVDFMNAHNALPVAYRLVTLADDVGPYGRGQRWAEPSLDDAAAKMRQVVADAELRQRLGRRARDDVRLHLAPEVIGERIAARLRVLQARRFPTSATSPR